VKRNYKQANTINSNRVNCSSKEEIVTSVISTAATFPLLQGNQFWRNNQNCDCFFKPLQARFWPKWLLTALKEQP